MIEFRRTRDFSSLFSSTFDFLAQNFGIAGKAFLVYVGPFVLLAGVLGSFYQADLFSGIFAGFADPAAFETFEEDFASIGLYLASIMVAAFAGVVAVVMFYSLILTYRTYGPANFDLPEIRGTMKEIFWPLVLLWLLTMVVFVGVFLLNIVPCLGQIAFVVIGVYLMVAFALAPMAMLAEDLGYVDSLKRAVALVKGHWWNTFALMFIAGIVMVFLQSALSMPMYGIMFAVGFLSTGDGGILLRVLAILTSVLEQIGLFFYGIVSVAAALQYFNLVERKEAPALMERIEQMSQEGEGPVGYPET